MRKKSYTTKIKERKMIADIKQLQQLDDRLQKGCSGEKHVFECQPFS